MPARLLAPAAIAASAAAFALFARVEWPWVLLGWCGLVPWLAVLDRAPTLARALGSGLLMCEAFALAVFFWFAAAMATYTGAPLAVGVVVLLLLGPIFQPQFLAFAAARHLAQRSRAGLWRTALTGACAYVGVEWLSPKLFADTIGHGLYASPLLRQAADLGGAHGLTFVLLIANACVLAALRAVVTPHGGWRRVAGPAAAVALLVGALLGYGAWRSRALAGAADAASLRAGIVQADISHYERLAAELGTYEAVGLILEAYFALSSELLESTSGPTVDLLVWPETVYPTTFGVPKSAAGAQFDRAIAGFVQRAGVPLIFGSYDAEGGDEFNAAVLLEPPVDGTIATIAFETYRKASLFPLTERVPALLEFPALRNWLPWLGSWKPGAGPRVLPLRLRDGRTLRVAPLICYDAVDPSLAIAAVRHGAEVIVTLSNDAWFASGGGPRLHLVVSAFRSIETRRPQVRSTNTGISAVIAPSGELLGTIGVATRGVLAESVIPNRSAWTLMLAWGDWFGPAALAVGVGLVVIALPSLPVRGVRTGGGDRGPSFSVAPSEPPMLRGRAITSALSGSTKGEGMRQLSQRLGRGLILACVVAAATISPAGASTINQNTSWTIDRAGTSTRYRVVAYGDSIFAGYRGSIFNVAKRAAPWVDGEYLSNSFATDIEVIRRTKSGAKADDIYNNKIINERSYMQNTSTRVVMFEMCGNDYLQARSSFNGQTGTCNYSVGENALAACTNYMGLAMNAINTYATTATRKMIANLYYPGYDADNGLSSCTDSVTGQPVNKQDNFLNILARSNWRACNLAEQRGFLCADSFAQYMGADYDSNGDTQIDSDALRYQSGESEAAYVTRITTTLRPTVRDANAHLVNASTSFDYILSDNTHPTHYLSATIGINIFTGSGSGSGAPDFSGGQIVGGKNPQWDRWGHERMGWGLSVFNPPTP